MRFATAFSLLLATVASVPASVLALPHDFAGSGVQLEARTRGAEPPYYARRSLEDIKLFLRSLDDDELLAVRETESMYWWRKNHGSQHQHGRSLDDDELLAVRDTANLRWFDARGYDDPPRYTPHDRYKGPKPTYTVQDPHPPPKYRKHDPKVKQSWQFWKPGTGGNKRAVDEYIEDWE
ncbi:hypothetical protein FOMPIDRAFT_1055888 [Fomitopsis schrenkii]|uniref:Uncharacterized protein n=1 Tax=Fomitopsis schrenkii TaxID=2126942 RepID=S8DLA4_FOMSC|nr:hypothetical protein FOMPIDRAFT_1055888 [Fomitopsis schrenkii]